MTSDKKKNRKVCFLFSGIFWGMVWGVDLVRMVTAERLKLRSWHLQNQEKKKENSQPEKAFSGQREPDKFKEG